MFSSLFYDLARAKVYLLCYCLGSLEFQVRSFVEKVVFVGGTICELMKLVDIVEPVILKLNVFRNCNASLIRRKDLFTRPSFFNLLCDLLKLIMTINFHL